MFLDNGHDDDDGDDPDTPLNAHKASPLMFHVGSRYTPPSQRLLSSSSSISTVNRLTRSPSHAIHAVGEHLQ
ncbi:hypothetical protein VTN02DRAFT_6398 [Thermoascus thermophilus]